MCLLFSFFVCLFVCLFVVYLCVCLLVSLFVCFSICSPGSRDGALGRAPRQEAVLDGGAPCDGQQAPLERRCDDRAMGHQEAREGRGSAQPERRQACVGPQAVQA